MKLNKVHFTKLNKNKKLKLFLKIYNKTKKKLQKTKFDSTKKNIFFIELLHKLKEKHSSIFSNVSIKNISKYLKLERKKKKFKLGDKKKYLTKRFTRVLKYFPRLKSKVYYNSKSKSMIKRKLFKMNSLLLRKRMFSNFSRKTYFFKILRKKRRRRLKVFRINRKIPIFTKKVKKEQKFLLKSRESLLKTKKYLYRKKFPKIKGKKNKNFNFFYYNNMDRVPFKFNIGRIVITYLFNNTFINIHNSKKMLKVISAGKLGLKGPKRSTAYSRQIVARKAINFIAKTKMNVLDIFLNSNYNRWYYFLFKEISKPKVKPYVIRYLIISNSRPHGFIRNKKHRRK